MVLTDQQRRVLDFCVNTAHGEWVGLIVLESVRLLENDDVLTVPSLVERQLLEHNNSVQAVRATEAGKIIVNA